MPLKPGNWQINISPSSEKDSGFWDPRGFGKSNFLSTQSGNLIPEKHEL